MSNLKLMNGQGYEFTNKISKFEITSRGNIKKFTNLDDAIEYYNGLFETKVFWDVGVYPSQLLQYHETIK